MGATPATGTRANRPSTTTYQTGCNRRKGNTVYHGNNPALQALDMTEQRIKEARATATPAELPGLNMALNIIRDTVDDVAPPRTLHDILMGARA